MRLTDLDYTLPRELIAQEPEERRDHSRLMVINRGDGSIRHHIFHELPDHVRSGDLLVVNDTQVVPARVFGRRQGFTGTVEFLFVRMLENNDCLVLARPGKKLPEGTVVELGKTHLPVEIREVLEAGRRVVRFPPEVNVQTFLEQEGHIPLPPYIQREDTALDRRRYQTVFAQRAGAVAAPTAGLHFTPELLQTLAHRGVPTSRVTLHVGPGTFVPVTAEDPRDHILEEEAYTVSGETAAAINQTRSSEGRVIAVGTTSVRTLETIAGPSGGPGPCTAQRGSGFTRTFIYPPYDFRLVDALITNFHLPKSSLLLLVAAFAGESLLRRAYQEAIAREYRFYSYGDAMLIL